MGSSTSTRRGRGDHAGQSDSEEKARGDGAAVTDEEAGVPSAKDSADKTQKDGDEEEKKEKDDDGDGDDESDEADARASEEENYPVYSKEEVDKMNFLKRTWKTVYYFVHRAGDIIQSMPIPVIFLCGFATMVANQLFVTLLRAVCPGPWVVWGVEVAVLFVVTSILMFKEDVARALFDESERKMLTPQTRCQQWFGCFSRAKYVARIWYKGRPVHFEQIHRITWFLVSLVAFLSFEVVSELVDLTLGSNMFKIIVYTMMLIFIGILLATSKVIAMALLTKRTTSTSADDTPREQGIQLVPAKETSADEHRMSLHREERQPISSAHSRSHRTAQEENKAPDEVTDRIRILVSPVHEPLPLPSESHIPPSPSPPLPAPVSPSSQKPRKEKAKRSSDEETSAREKKKGTQPSKSTKGKMRPSKRQPGPQPGRVSAAQSL